MGYEHISYIKMQKPRLLLSTSRGEHATCAEAKVEMDMEDCNVQWRKTAQVNLGEFLKASNDEIGTGNSVFESPWLDDFNSFQA